jgi:hypothetical protein
MTAQTVAYLKGTEFTLTGAAGRIGPGDLDDVCDSYLPWDVNPTGGTPMPYVYMGVLHGSAYYQSLGGVIGSGNTTLVQQNNATYLQATITYAITNNLLCWLLPGVYEIYNATGVVLPGTVAAYGTGVLGSMWDTEINQFYPIGPGAPIFTIGDTVSTTNETFGVTVSGLFLSYGVPQSGSFTATIATTVLTVTGTPTGAPIGVGQVISGAGVTAGTTITSLGTGTGGAGTYNLSVSQTVSGATTMTNANPKAQPLVMGTLIDSVVENIACGGYTYPAYDGVALITANTGNAGVFSNRFANIFVWGVLHDMLNLGAHSTGNHWDNVYLNNGGGSPQPMSGHYLDFSFADLSSVFTRLNCEWGSCNSVVNAVNYNVRGLVFNGPHFEGITLTGASPCVFLVAAGSMMVNGLSLESLTLLSGNLTSGNYALIQDYNAAGDGTHFAINGLIIILDTASTWTSALYAYIPNAMLNDDVSVITIENGEIHDNSGTAQNVGRFLFDSHLALNVVAVTVNRWGRYSFGTHGSRIEKLVLAVSATYTHYGQLEDATILVPATVTSFTITLGVTMGATGTQAVKPGNTVRIRRLGAQANTGTLSLSGATLGSVCNNGQPPDFFGVFGGVSSAYTFTWAAYTPVT